MMGMIGERIIDAIVSGRLMRMECPDSPESSCVCIWSVNAAEQIEAIMNQQTDTADGSRGCGCYLGEAGVYHRPRKPAPLFGIVPRKVWVENRADDIMEAMEQYRRGKYIIPIEWVEELAEHLRTLGQSR